MWFLNNTKYAVRDLLNETVDFHSHILPCVDDGCATSEESCEALMYYETIGLKKVIFTPHIMERYPENTYDALRARFNDFRKNYRGPLSLNLGAEYMIDGSIHKHLEKGRLLTIMEDHLLVELPLNFPLLNYTHIMQDIMALGYFVVLAHPERYTYINRKQFDNLRDLGIKFQLNLLSFSEIYGKNAHKRAQDLLKNDFYDLWGTDYHKMPSQIFMEKRCIKEADFELLIHLKEKIKKDT